MPTHRKSWRLSRTARESEPQSLDGKLLSDDGQNYESIAKGRLEQAFNAFIKRGKSVWTAEWTEKVECSSLNMLTESTGGASSSKHASTRKRNWNDGKDQAPSKRAKVNSYCRECYMCLTHALFRTMKRKSRKTVMMPLELQPTGTLRIKSPSTSNCNRRCDNPWLRGAQLNRTARS